MVCMRREAWCVWLALPALAVELRVDPGRERLRPLETAAVVVRPAMPEGSVLRVTDPDGGWLSRPFRRPDGTAVLYTAPPRPGRYTIEARLRSVRLEVEVEVTPSAPSHRAAESISFGPEPDTRDFYRDLAEHYAPLVAQETWFEPKADYLARFDYDGDWRGDNNWDNLPTGSSQAYVYWAAMETATHYFIVYNFFHPRRYAEDCSTGCQENDNGGVIALARKDGSRFGKLQLMQALTNNTVYTYTSDGRIREGIHRIHGDLKVWRESHPVVFVESGSHGVFGAGDAEHCRFSADRMEFAASTGVVYRFGGSAARPAHPNDRDVSYELLPIAEHWWHRAATREGLDSRTFDDYGRYTPFGGRPAAAAEEIASAFFGRKFFPNKARPFWGWHDAVALSRRILAPGQWGLDPAYAVAATLKLPQGVPFSLDYLYHPFLAEVGRRDAVTALARPQRSEPAAGAGGSQGGNRQLLSAPAEKPRYNLRSRQGTLEFRARVDGGVYLHIRGDQIEVEYLSGRPIDEVRYRFSQPLPAAEMEEVKLEDVDGRGSVRLLEWPNQGNQYTAKVRIQDEKPGASPYRFKLVWKH
jgi:hypothetical protein